MTTHHTQSYERANAYLSSSMTDDSVIAAQRKRGVAARIYISTPALCHRRCPLRVITPVATAEVSKLPETNLPPSQSRIPTVHIRTFYHADPPAVVPGGIAALRQTASGHGLALRCNPGIPSATVAQPCKGH
jgi:hypothetical protein